MQEDELHNENVTKLPKVDEASEMSPHSSRVNTSMKKKKKKKKKNEPITIEDIFNSVSTISAGMLNPPPARITLTPRSAEACLKHGVNPEVLKIRDLDSFWEPGLDPAVQVLRHEAYSQRRHELMRMTRAERKRLIAEEMRSAEMARLNHSSTQPGQGLTPAQIMEDQEKATATMIRMEQIRTEKLRRRQEKELEQMLAFEMKQAQIQEEMAEKMERENLRVEQKKKEEMKRQRQLAEERRIRELRKRAVEEAEEEARKRVAKDMFEREQKVRRDQEQRERMLRLEAQRREEERQLKLEEYKAKTKKMLDDQTEQIRRKFEDMETAEQERKRRMDRQRKQEAKRAADRRQKIEQRIENNLQMAQKIQDKRKNDFFQKQIYHEEKLREKEQEREMERMEQQRRIQQQERKRQAALNQARREEEQRKEDLLQKFDEQEATLWNVKQMQMKEAMLEKEKRELRKQIKRENVERIRRIQEYKRLETMRRINEGDKRATAIEQQRKKIIDSRRELGLKTKIERDSLMQLMDKAKSSGARATNILKKAIDDDSSTPSGTKRKKRRPKRSKSAQKGMHGSSSMPNINQRTSQSAGPSMGDGGALGPPPEAASLERRLRDKYGPETSAPTPYKSPYDMDGPMMPNASKTITF